MPYFARLFPYTLFVWKSTTNFTHKCTESCKQSSNSSSLILHCVAFLVYNSTENIAESISNRNYPTAESANTIFHAMILSQIQYLRGKKLEKALQSVGRAVASSEIINIPNKICWTILEQKDIETNHGKIEKNVCFFKRWRYKARGIFGIFGVTMLRCDDYSLNWTEEQWELGALFVFFLRSAIWNEKMDFYGRISNFTTFIA